jgi:hypothetical protein
MGPTRLAETHLAECYNWPNTIGRKPQLADATIGQMEQLAEKILSHPKGIRAIFKVSETSITFNSTHFF